MRWQLFLIAAAAATELCFASVVVEGGALKKTDGEFKSGDFDVEKQLRVLSKQVTALLERREEDLKSIEDNIRRTIVKDSPEVYDLRDEVRDLRLLVNQLGGGNSVPKPKQEKTNDKLTTKWLSNAISELKTEVGEMQSALNSSVILQNHEHVETQFSLFKSDISNLNAELENARRKNAKYEAELMIFRDEFESLKDNWKNTAVICGKTKNQLKSFQIEWQHNWHNLNQQKSTPLPPLDEKTIPHSSRHQKILRQHIINLEKSSKSLHKENYALKSQLLRMEEEIDILKRATNPVHNKKYDRINGNDIENYIESNKIKEIDTSSRSIREDVYEKIVNVTEQQISNTNSIANLTKQLSNFDKLHLSMLELLENVESIENRVDNTLPEFRKEISKLEVQVSEATSDISLLKEDQKNIRDSLKAIGFTVSSMQDKTNQDHLRLDQLENHTKALEKSSTVQNSRLHDHILKDESSTMNLNATKSTIHLVQELKSFESEYKSIVNKLPRNCGGIEGPSGIYLISPGDGEPILAHCNEGWTTVQKRYDGSVNFNRNWNEYSNGFGSATGEHWLGNRNLHHLTRENCTRLKINMKDIYGKYWQATYDDFRVADFARGFKLSVFKYSGNASDALNYQNLMEFSTVDNDRDISNTHCASNYEGGWWFSHCQHANLNGRYNLGLTWFDSSRNEWIAVASSEMSVKRRDVC